MVVGISGALAEATICVGTGLVPGLEGRELEIEVEVVPVQALLEQGLQKGVAVGLRFGEGVLGANPRSGDRECHGRFHY